MRYSINFGFFIILFDKILTLVCALNNELLENVCQTDVCVKTAGMVIGNLNLSADPCDDFYNFACGNFEVNTVLANDKTSETTFSIVTDSVFDQLKNIVNETVSQHEPVPFKYMKQLYHSCLDVEKLNSLGLQPARDMLDKLGSWPVLNDGNWDEHSFSWISQIYKFRKYGYSADYILDLTVAPDIKNTTGRVIYIDSPYFTIKKEYLRNEGLITAYFAYMVDVAVLFGADRTRAQAELKESLLFEMALSNITLLPEDRRDVVALYNPTSIEQAMEINEHVPWLEYINTILSPTARVTADEVIVFVDKNYVQRFSEVMKSTSKRSQANYLLWKAMSWSIKYLSDDVRKRQLQYWTAVTGRKSRPPRWKECVDLATGSFFLASASLYVRRYFKEESKIHALEIVNDVKREMTELIKTTDWMDDSTKKNALDKVGSIVDYVAYPNELLNDDNIVGVYKMLDFNAENYYQSLLNYTRFASDYSFAKLRKPVNKTDWVTHSQADTVNALYNIAENSIEFPAGILQGTFFSSERPKYMNYGAIGFIIGHEIIHGFDDKGSQFDKNGNLLDWWNPTTKSRYLEKAQCIIDQYSNFSVPQLGLKLNGKNIQGECIADDGGIRLAYLAYQRFVRRNGQQEDILPRRELGKFNARQLFWISAAQVWCAKFRPESLLLRVKSEVHAPEQYRVIGSFSNQPEFANDFNCPVGSRMNPAKKCRVW